MHIGEIVKVGEREPTYEPAQAQPIAIPQLFPGIPAVDPDRGEPASPDPADEPAERRLEPAYVEPRRPEPAEPLKEREFEDR